MGSFDTDLLKRLARTVRGLTIDATEAANSGHPGLPLGCADLAVTLWYHFLRYNPEDPAWPGRDKFILSGGHGSMLLYALLHLAGYDLPMEELKNFRQLGSKTPGHPESDLTPGVETTTGPLGQGFANGVGFALADAMMAARVHREDFRPFDSFVYAIVSDGDLMEGVAQEAASFAGHMKLGNIIYLYDDNDVSLDGPTALTFNREDTAGKFEAMGWHVQKIDGLDHKEVATAIAEAQDEKQRPSLIICKTVIGYGAPKKAGTSAAHGSPLGGEEAKAAKEFHGIPLEPTFYVPEDDHKAWAERAKQLRAVYDKWQKALEDARGRHPDAVQMMEAHLAQELPGDLESKLPQYDPEKAVASRKASQAALKAIAPEIPWLVGGSGDLSVSTNAFSPDWENVQPGQLDARHLWFGVREHGMGAIVNGMVRSGLFRAFGATFLTFSDYMRAAVRLSSLMHCPSIWVYSHDSIFLGEDGPTHQSIEHVAALRAIPGLILIRPGDAVETAEAWLAALREKEHPVAIILTRQNIPTFDRSKAEFEGEGSLAQGAYIFRKEKDSSELDGILIGTGSELHLCVEAARALEAEGKSIRVVSMPSWELFERQDRKYREVVLPKSCTHRLAVEAGVSLGWARWVGSDTNTVAVNRFGASAPLKDIAREFGFTTENVLSRMRKLLDRKQPMPEDDGEELT